MTEMEGARQLEKYAAALPAAAEKGLAEALKEARDRAIWWSSGPWKTRELRRLGHPYARAERGQPRLDPGRINIQSGGIVEGWAFSPVVRGAGGMLTASLYNEAPEARFMAGTRRMVERPLPERVLADLEESGKARAAVEAALDAIRGD